MAQFIIDEKIHQIELLGKFQFGDKKIISDKQTDPTYDQDWYNEGYKVIDFFDNKSFLKIKNQVKKYIQKIMNKNFCLTKYHNFINEKQHEEITKKTRDILSKDFNFLKYGIIGQLEKKIGFNVTNINQRTGEELHAIIRINRPLSNDYNPPHKDIYQELDETGHVPKCINVWIPICGVNKNSSLPLAPKSHLIPENEILRNFDGGLLNGKQYRVRGILSWNGDNKLIRPKIKNKQILIFSSHLIHGCAVNDQKDTTRISLELRLFPKNSKC